MATSPSSLHTPARSISLPTRLVHPSCLRIEAELSKLQTLESPSSAAGIQLGLKRLAEIFDCINEQVICSPHTQQALHHHQHVKLVEDALDVSMVFLDACDFTRDLVSMMKQQVQDLQSALRRRGGNYSSIEHNLHAYLIFQKKSKKEIAKRLKALLRMERNINKDTPFLKYSVVDHQISMVSNVLRQSSTFSISIFKSLMSFLSSPVEKTKSNGWSLLGKLIPAGAKQRDQNIFDGLGCVDTALLCFLHGGIQRNNNKIDVQVALKRLETLNVRLEAIQDELDCVSRRLIKHRASLLNVLTP